MKPKNDKQRAEKPISLDRSKLLGFDQLPKQDSEKGLRRLAKIGEKVGLKDAIRN